MNPLLFAFLLSRSRFFILIYPIFSSIYTQYLILTDCASAFFGSWRSSITVTPQTVLWPLPICPLFICLVLRYCYQSNLEIPKSWWELRAYHPISPSTLCLTQDHDTESILCMSLFGHIMWQPEKHREEKAAILWSALILHCDGGAPCQLATSAICILLEVKWNIATSLHLFLIWSAGDGPQRGYAEVGRGGYTVSFILDLLDL